MSRSRKPFSMSLVLVLAACGHESPSSPDPSLGPAALPSGIVARVGPELVDGASVQRIQRAQRVSVEAASNRAVQDALYAVAARQRLPSATVRQAERGALARALLEEIHARAISAGSPTDAEVDEATAARWWDLDRPPLLRTTHVVVEVKKPEQDAAARALAERIAAAVAGADTPDAFRRAASAVPAGKLKVTVQDLDPVARDRRFVNPNSPPPPGTQTGEYSAAYVDAAYAIPGIGKQSPVVRSEFGYHVILAVEQIPERRVPLAERRTLLERDILNHRAILLRDQMRESVRAATKVEVERAAVELMEKAPP